MATRSSSSKTPSKDGTVSAHRETGQSVKRKTKEMAQAVSEEAMGHAETAKQAAVSHAEDAKDAVAAEGENVANALRTAAQELRGGSAPERTLGQIADGIADVSDAIREKDLGQIVAELNGMSRRNPAIFLGAAALLGFAAVRFAKASTPDAGSATAGRVGESAPQLSSSHLASGTTAAGPEARSAHGEHGGAA